MKKAVVIFVIAALVIITTVLWLSKSDMLGGIDLMSLVIIGLLVVFAVFIGIRRFSGARRGEPAEDELSKKVLQKTAAWSYYISLYMWVAMIYIKDRVKLDIEEILGIGILAMAVAFALCWIIFNFKGIRNE
jgi:peptidoglycan/LPS O-acetylase OafA/YrhL